jgi:hypothetical protein
MSCCSSHLDDNARRYIRELTEVLAALDLEQLKTFYRKWETAMELPPMPDDTKLEEDMHLMILELPGLSDLHQSSREWLLGRGLAITIRDLNCGIAGRPRNGENTA